jgi:RNA polymerase sigma-70 factor, ECF subfamily
VLRNQLRRREKFARHSRPLNGELVSHPSVDTAREDPERAERVARALAALPERYEAVLQAKYLDEKSVAQIAAAWAETPKAVESLLTRARQAFRQMYQQREHTDG